MKKYVVRLEAAERERLQRLVRGGRAAAYKVRHAQMLLMADADGPAWADERIAEGLGVSVGQIVDSARRRAPSPRRQPPGLPRQAGPAGGHRRGQWSEAMRYMLLIYSSEQADMNLTEGELGRLMEGYQKFTQELMAAKAYIASDRLRPIETATTVRLRDGKTLTTDGPFAETKEQLGGYYLINAKNLDEALRWAAKIPSATYGSVEVRPIWEMEGAPCQS